MWKSQRGHSGAKYGLYHANPNNENSPSKSNSSEESSQTSPSLVTTAGPKDEVSGTNCLLVGEETTHTNAHPRTKTLAKVTAIPATQDTARNSNKYIEWNL